MTGNLRWMADRLPNVKTVMDRYHILDRMVNRNLTKMRAAGSPATYWRNSAVGITGITPAGLTKCYCWATPTGGSTQQSTPDRTHFLCIGTGYLEGYQRYGYTEVVLATTSTFTKSSANILISGERNSTYLISGGSLIETLTSDKISLTNFKDVNYFLANDAATSGQSRIKYYYSTDDVNWHEMTMTDIATTQLANRQGALQLSTGTTYVRFRISLEKRLVTSPSPKWNSMRFRYRKQITLREMDPHFAIDAPAFLAAREQQVRAITQGERGWEITFPLEWWTLPDADIKNADVIAFLQGRYTNYRFEVKNLREFTYGENLQVLHKAFESTYIRDAHALLGIIHYLI